jgi:hypothetical protein
MSALIRLKKLIGSVLTDHTSQSVILSKECGL